MTFERIEESLGVFEQFSLIEVGFAKSDVDDGLLINAIFDFTSFGFFDSFFKVDGNGAGFWIWHEAFWSE